MLSRSLSFKSLPLLLSLALLASGPADAGVPGLTLTVPDLKIPEVAPREIVTLAIVVANVAGGRRELSEELVLPAGWTPLYEREAFRLGPGGSDIRLLAVRVPAPENAPAGIYSLRYRAWQKGEPDAALEIDVKVCVTALARLEVSLEAAPRMAVAGRDYEARFIVANRGNVDGAVDLDVLSTDNFPAEADARRFPLPAGRSRAVRLLVHTDAQAPQAVSHQVRLAARLEGSGEAPVQAAAQVNVVPLVTRKFDSYRRLPTQAGVSAGSEQGQRALQFEWSGAGALDENGQRKVDFHFQQPLDQTLPLFGFRQEYRAGFQSQTGYARAGDMGYTLSPLIQLYEFGRGAQAGARVGDLTFGGFAMETRGRPVSEQREAAYLAYAPTRALEVRGNWLERGAWGSDSIGSVQAKAGPAAGLGLNLEYALGRAPKAFAPPSQQAWNARLEGKAWGRFPVLVERIRAGRDFSGYYRDSEITRLQLGAPITANADFSGSYYKDVFNLDADPSRAAAPTQQRARAGLRLRQTPRTSWTLDYERQTSNDRMPAPTVDALAQQAALGLTRIAGRLTARLSGSLNRVTDRLASHGYDYGGGGADFSYALTARQTYTAFVQAGPQGLVVDSPRETVVGGGADLTPLEGLSLSAQLERRDPGATGPSSMRYLGTARWRFLRTNTLSLRAQWFDFQGAPRPSVTSVLGSYSHDFDIPLWRRGDLGGLAGTLSDAQSGRGLKDVVINAGGALAVTDDKGRFRFLALDPGEHYLWVESLDEGLIIDRKLPAKLLIEGGKTRRLDLKALRAATLNLTVLLYQAAGNPAVVSEEEQLKNLVEVGGLSGVIVELSRDDETIMRATDAEGRLTLRNLRPGRWKARVDASRLPEHTKLEREGFEVELGPGAERAELVRVIPRLRELIIIEEK